jgi:hypothetical protein
MRSPPAPPTLAILATWLACIAFGEVSAQDRRGLSTGGEARTDALLATPNNATPVPQTNRFSTAPALEQQAPAPAGKTAAGQGGDRGPVKVAPR